MDGLSPEDEKFVAYTAELVKLEAAGERSVVAMGPFTVVVLIGALQLVLRHPEVTGLNRKIIQGLIRDLSVPFAGTLGEEMIKRGDHPEFDIKTYEDRRN